VCSDDVFACAEEAIVDIRPVLTMVGGEIVHGDAERLEAV
jgi:predicted amidohydrolase YtcJ